MHLDKLLLSSAWRQADIDAGPVVMGNLCTMNPEGEDALLAAWAENACFTKAQTGFILAVDDTDVLSQSLGLSKF